jgi:hypothetical protein
MLRAPKFTTTATASTPKKLTQVVAFPYEGDLVEIVS